MSLRKTMLITSAAILTLALVVATACSSPAPASPTKPAEAPKAAEPTKAAAPAKAAEPTKAAEPAKAAPQYPTKNIELIIPFAAGGVVDQVGRFIAAYAQEKWKVSVVVTNKAGGGGFIGTVAGLQAQPDGYTLFLNGPSSYMGLAATKNPPFKIEDGVAINRITMNPVNFAVKGDSKWNTLKEAVEDVKKAPEKYKLASAGNAGLATFAAARLWMQAGIDPAKVPIVTFDGGAPAHTAVAGGSCDFTSQNLAEAMALYEAKKLKILAITTPERFKKTPEIPTSKEAGFDQYNTVGFVDLWGPNKTADHVVAAWDNLVKEALKDPKFLDQLDKAGFLPGYQSPKEHRDWINAEYKSNVEIANKLGIVQ